MAAARAAFLSFSRTTKGERLELPRSILAEYRKRYDDVAAALNQDNDAHRKVEYGDVRFCCYVIDTTSLGTEEAEAA